MQNRPVLLAPLRGTSPFPIPSTRFGLRNVGILALFLSTLTILALSLAEASPAILISYILFGVLGYMITLYVDRDSSNGRIFAIVYGCSATVAVAVYYIYMARYSVPYINGGSDDLFFEEQAKQVARAALWVYDPKQIRLIINYPNHNATGYIYLVSFLIRLGDLLGGFHTMMPRLLNGMALGLVSVFIFSIAKEVKLGLARSKVVALWSGLFPMMLFVSAHVFRDIIVTLIVVMVLKLALSLQKERSLPLLLFYTMIILLLTLILGEIRFPHIVIPLGILFVSWYVRISLRLPRWTLLIGIAIVFIGLVVFRQPLQAIPWVERISNNVDFYTEDLQFRSDGFSQIVFGLSFPLNIIGRLVYATIAPMPVWYANFEWTLLGIGSLLQFMYFPFIFLGILVVQKKRNTWPLLAGFLIVLGGYVYGSFTFRHISQIVPFATVLAVFGYDKYKAWRRPIWAACSILLVMGFITYVMLK